MLPMMFGYGCRIHPNEVMTFTIDRKGESLEIPVKPAEAPDGTGRIGVQLAANAQVTRNVSKDPLQAVQLAAKQFGKLTKTVVMGKQSDRICFFSVSCLQLVCKVLVTKVDCSL